MGICGAHPPLIIQSNMGHLASGLCNEHSHCANMHAGMQCKTNARTATEHTLRINKKANAVRLPECKHAYLDVHGRCDGWSTHPRTGTRSRRCVMGLNPHTRKSSPCNLSTHKEMCDEFCDVLRHYHGWGYESIDTTLYLDQRHKLLIEHKHLISNAQPDITNTMSRVVFI